MQKPLPSALLLTACSFFATLADPSSVDARPVRGTTRTSVQGGGRANVQRGADVDRGRDVNRDVSRDIDRDIQRDVDVHHDYDVDIDHDYYHPVATAAAVTAVAVTTAAVVGSIVYSLPPSCTAVVSSGVTYQQCGSTWYQPRYSGSQVTYVVVDPP